MNEQVMQRGVFGVEKYFSPRSVDDEEVFIAYLGFRRTLSGADISAY